MRSRYLLLVHAQVFLGAFLLFSVQPAIAKKFLPWYGGTSAVWIVCLLFFQTQILSGYLYGHLITGKLKFQTQCWVHALVLLASLSFLPLRPEPNLGGPEGSPPAVDLLILLSRTLVLPALILSATSPLAQRWASSIHPDRSHYRLYSTSNLGSLIALAAYPFLIEPICSLQHQLDLWSYLYFGYLILSICLILGLVIPGSRKHAGDSPKGLLTVPGLKPLRTQGEGRPSLRQLIVWCVLAALGSILLLSTTTEICQEVAPIPLLFLGPLMVYLTTFILVFHSDAWYHRKIQALAYILFLPLVCAVVLAGLRYPLPVQILVPLVSLFLGCMLCHGELVKSKPPEEFLTHFYLAVGGGGALGGSLCVLLFPKLFKGYSEYPICLAVVGFIAGGILWEGVRPYKRSWTYLRWILPLIILAVSINSLLFRVTLDSLLHPISLRNFYGVLRVSEGADRNGKYRGLVHGRILHGFQYVDDEKSRWCTSYFGEDSGVGLAFGFYRMNETKESESTGLRVGVVGLGIGTLVNYGTKEDYFRIYEINPNVVEVAETWFTNLRDSPAKKDIRTGDGRLLLEQDLEQFGGSLDFDLLVLDAFSSDAIPVHLLTREAVSLYLKHIKKDGFLLFNLTNRYVDLTPLIKWMAEEFGKTGLIVDTEGDQDKGTLDATWGILTESKEFLASELVAGATPAANLSGTHPIVWTDDFSALWPVLKLGR